MYSFLIKCANVNIVVYGNLMVECNLERQPCRRTPISGSPCWMTSHPVLQEIPSDLNYIPTHIRSTISKNGGKM